MIQLARQPTLLTAFLSAAFTFSFFPTARANPASATPVLLITVDTLRADRLSCYGSRQVRTPAMDALAARGTRFETALAQVPITLPSHAVILTGTYPMYNGVRDFTSRGLPPGVGLLAEAFKRHGYLTAAFVSAFVLDSTWGFGRGFETYDDQFDPRQFETRNPGRIERRAGETVDRLLAWLRSRSLGRTAARPFFVWLHLYDPHSDYNPPEPFHTQYAGHLYDGEVAYVDSQLTRLFNYLKQTGLYDRALIVILSDHGESLGEHGEDEHGFFIYNSTLRIPLIFKLPRGQGLPRVVHSPVGTIDVAPTLLELLSIQDPVSRQFQGSSLASLILGKSAPAERPVYSETYYPRDSFGWSALRSFSTARYHYIEAPLPELYDLEKDPVEEQNIYGQRRAEGAALRNQLLDFERRYANAAASPGAAGPPLSPETLEKLRSLGYIAYSAPAAAGPGETFADPKDRLKLFNSILRATDLAAVGHLEASNALLRKVAADEPHLYLIPFMLAENAARAKQWQEAEQQFLACLKLNPSFQQAIMGLARAYVAEGKGEQAQPWLELAVHDNPHNFLAYHGLGLVARLEHQNEEARRNFLKAAEEKPNYAPSQQELGIVLVEMQRYAEALGPLTRASELGPENPVLANYLGTAYANTGRTEQAIESYKKAVTLKSDYAAARLNLAFAYLKLGDRTNATREFHVLCQQDSSLCQQYRSKFE